MALALIALLDELALALIIFVAILFVLYRLEILGLAEVVIVSAVLAISMSLLLVKIVRAQRERIKVGPEAYIGMEARVVEASGKRGMALIEGELWKVESEEALSPGDVVVVIDRSANVLKVKRGGR